MIGEHLWVEKYRPTTLDEMALSDEQRTLFQKFIDDGEIPHLLLVGPPGTGKTTIAKILNDRIDAKVLTLNASNERGIDMIRQQVVNFARGRMQKNWNHVFMDEADALTPEAQNALRNTMETYASVCRFILTGNDLHKIIQAVRSRCVEVVLAQTEFKQRFDVLKRILDEEGVEADPQTILGYAERYSDLRQLIMRAQKSVLSNGGQLGPASQIEISGKDIFELIKDDDYSKIREAASVPGFDAQQALRALFNAVPDDFNQAARFRFTIAKALTDSVSAPDPVITFLGAASECITFIKG